MEKSDVEKQLDRVTEDYQNRLSQRYLVRNFNITVWVAVLIAIATDKLNISICNNINYFLLIIPLIMFWIFELILTSIIQRRESFICNLEEILFEDDLKGKKHIDISYISKDRNRNLFRKFIGLVDAFFSLDTSNVFYIIQIIASIILIHLFGFFTCYCLFSLFLIIIYSFILFFYHRS